MLSRIACSAAFVSLFALGCSSAAGPDGPGEPTRGDQLAARTVVLGAATPFATPNDLANLALANVGGMACARNSLGGSAFESSCTGNGGQPEYWCADFVKWVWANSGVDVAGLNAAAGSFYVYGQNHGTLKNSPAVGDAVVFDYAGGGVADHVAIVTKVNADGTIESVSGDWGGQSGSEATFSSTSHVVLNSPAYPSAVGGSPSVIGMTISGYIAPVGLTQPYAAGFVSQSFPLASSALKMTAGETVSAYIEMKNTGGQTWNSSTRLATSQPRDRASVFADGSWLSPNRLAEVKGTVSPGSTYKFTFNLHAPEKPGTYYEYFNLVQENVCWFSDPGQGGPPDDDLEVQVLVVAAPDAGGAGHAADAGAMTTADQDAGTVAPRGDAGTAKAPPQGASPAGDAPSATDGGDAAAAGGCAMTPARRAGEGAAWLALAVGVAAAFARRRRSARS